MRFLRRSLTGIFLVSVTLGILAWAGNTFYSALQTRWAQDERVRPARERVFAVNVLPVEPGSITPILTSYGEVRSRRTLDLRTTAGGMIVELAEGFEEGGEVVAGQLLARIDPRNAQSALAVIGADLQEATAELRDAKRGLELAEDELRSAEEQAGLRRQALARQENLLTRGVGTEAAVETAALAVSLAQQAVLSRRQAIANAQARIDQADTSLSRTRINLAEAERALADTKIYAGFSGTLAQVSVVQGGLINNNERIAQIVDANALEVAFRVSTPQYVRLLGEDGRLLQADGEISLDIAGVDLVTKGQISRESAAVGEGQTGRLLFARLAEVAGFRPGDFVTVRIAEPPLQDVALLPAAAVDAAGQVLVLGEQDRLEVAQTSVLRRQGDAVIVSAGNIAGREVVAERSPLLGAGIRVRAIRPGVGTADNQPAEPEMIELSEERRAKLVAFVTGNQFMPEDAKARVLVQLKEPKVPAKTVARIESRMGG